MPYKDLSKRKECSRRYYLNNREIMIERSKKDYEDNKVRKIEMMRVRRLNNPERTKADQRRSTLKRACWTPESFDKAIEEQNNRCAICGLEKPLVADHDHNRMVPRAPLCNDCNFMLGNARDNPVILEAGAQYLRKHSDAKKEIN